MYPPSPERRSARRTLQFQRQRCAQKVRPSRLCQLPQTMLQSLSQASKRACAVRLELVLYKQRIGPLAASQFKHATFDGLYALHLSPLYKTDMDNRCAGFHALPMSTPAASTRLPPTSTCRAARSHGVSMYLFWIQVIAKSSTTTTIAAIVVAVQKCGIR
jgi:hypothetical protein